jgi:hypothetical protein
MLAAEEAVLDLLLYAAEEAVDELVVGRQLKKLKLRP